MATSTIKAPDKRVYTFSTTGKTFTLSNGLRAKMTIYDSSETACGIYIIGVTGAGYVNIKNVATSNATITTSTNSMTLKSATGSPYAVFEIIVGTITE